jgi:hypothetical protein
MTRVTVAASGERRDADGVRVPAGEAHAWFAGHNQTVCGLSLSRTRLRVFPHVPWDYRDTDVLNPSDDVRYVCPRCLAALRARPRRGRRRTWTRTSPRP